MAHISFTCGLSTFVNWYLSIESVDEITPERLDEQGFYDDDTQTLSELLKSHYNENVTIEFIPDKMSTFANITFEDGQTLEWETCDDDDFLAKHVTESYVEENYRGFDVKSAKVFGKVFYAVAIFNKFLDFHVFFATLEDAAKYIDRNPNGL